MSRIDPVGEIIDKRFRILAPIGVGGFAAVYQAEQLGMNRMVAVKFLHIEATADDDLLERFSREAKILATLNHKNIVACYAYGIWRNRIPYLVLEYLEGETLQRKLARQGCLPWAEAFRYGIEVCEALTELHKNQIIHRDLKPENIMLTSDGRVKIIDFGLAAVDGQRLTQAGTLVGSLFYLSPEQATASLITSSSDIYSLGCVLYHAIAGAQPFDGSVPVEVLYKHVNEQPRPLTALPESSIPSSVNKVILTAMRKEPDSRFCSATEFGAAMQSALQQETVTVPPAQEVHKPHSAKETNPRPFSKMSAWALTLSVLVSVGVLTAFISQLFKPEPREKIVLRVKDDLETANFQQRWTPDLYGELLRWQKDSRPGVVNYLRGPDSGQSGNASERVAAIADAVKLAAEEKLGAELEGRVLVSQLNSWLSAMVTYQSGDLEKWLDKATLLLSDSELSWTTRDDLAFRIRTVAGKLSTHQMDQIRPGLASNIFRPGSHEFDSALLSRAESRLRSIIQLIPADKTLTAIDSLLLYDYASLLSGTGRGLEALILLRPYLDSGLQTPWCESQLAEAFACAQISCGSVKDAFALMSKKRGGDYDAGFARVLGGVVHRGLSSDLNQAEEALRLRLKAKPLNTYDFISRQVQLATLYEMRGRYKDALAILHDLLPSVTNEGNSGDWLFCVFRLSTLAYIGIGDLRSAETSLREAEMSLDRWPSLATPDCKYQLKAMQSMLASELEVQQLERGGLSHTIHAWNRRNCVKCGTFEIVSAFAEQRSLENLEAIDFSDNAFTRQHIWQCVHDLLCAYDIGNRSKESVAFYSKYRPVILKLAETGKEWNSAQSQVNSLLINHCMARAHYKQVNADEALKFSLAAMKHHCIMGIDEPVRYVTDNPQEFIVQHARIAQLAKSVDSKRSAELLGYVVKALKQIKSTSSRMEIGPKVAEILCEGGFKEDSEKLFAEAESYFAKRKELSWQLVSMRRHCAALCKIGHYRESDQIAKQALLLSSDSQDPLIKILHSEFDSLQSFHKLPTTII